MNYLTWSMRTSTVPEHGIDNLACVCIRAGAAGRATTTGHTNCGPLSSITTWLEVPTARDAMLDLLEEVGLPGDEVVVRDATAQMLSRGGHLVLVEDRDNHDSGTLYFFTDHADAQALYEQQASEYADHLDSDQCRITHPVKEYDLGPGFYGFYDFESETENTTDGRDGVEFCTIHDMDGEEMAVIIHRTGCGGDDEAAMVRKRNTARFITDALNAFDPHSTKYNREDR